MEIVRGITIHALGGRGERAVRDDSPDGLGGGFTVVELLVTVLLIILLAGLLFAVQAGARGKAKQSACMSNLRQLVTAIRMYADDHGGLPPPHESSYDCYGPDRGTLMLVLAPYVRDERIWFCPADPWAGKPVVANMIPHVATSYRTQLSFFRADPADYEYPDCALITDGMWYGKLPLWHSGGYNAAYPDGSARWFPNQQPGRAIDGPHWAN